MRALTIHQPWAALIASGAKLIENRKTRPPRSLIDQRFAIHAGLERSPALVDYIRDLAPDLDVDAIVARHGATGAIVATARLEGWCSTSDPTLKISPPEQARWFFGPIGFILSNVRALSTPVAARGMQGFWPVPADVARLVLEREARS